MLFSLVLLFELLEIIVLTMKKLFPLFFALHFRVRLDCSLPEISERPFQKNLSSNLNYLFVSFFIRFSMISGQCPDPIETVACSFQGLCYIDSLFVVSTFQRRPFGRHITSPIGRYIARR